MITVIAVFCLVVAGVGAIFFAGETDRFLKILNLAAALIFTGLSIYIVRWL